MCGLREALEKALETLPTMAYSNGYPVQALPKAELLSLLALHPASECLTITDEVDRKFVFNGDEADEVWVDKP